MAIFEVDKDAMIEIFDTKENVKKSVFAVMDNRLTASHLASDVFILIEMLEKLEIALIGEPVVQVVPPPPVEQPQPPAQDQTPAPESAPADQPPTDQNQSQ
jgi:hypothetical protein